LREEREEAISYAKFNNIPYETLGDLVKNEKILHFMQGEVDWATPNLANYEKVKKIRLLERNFEIDKGEVTPTYKVKRNIVEEKYRSAIDAMYKKS
jgi:long-chain acyl-CoA synthetase